jgi:hypothetical protein
VFHRRQRRAVHHRNPEPSHSQAAGENAADGASAYDTNIDVHFLPSPCNAIWFIPAQNIGIAPNSARGDFIPAAAHFL